MKVCVVSRGEYSDYQNIAVFSSKKKALEWVLALPVEIIEGGTNAHHPNPVYYVNIRMPEPEYASYVTAGWYPSREEAEERARDTSVRLGIFEFGEWEVDSPETEATYR